MLEPAPGAVPLIDYRSDAQRVFDVVANGGIAIVPVTTGYALVGASTDAVASIIKTKQRSDAKVTALCGSDEVSNAVHIVGEDRRRFIDGVTQFFRLPLGILAPVRQDHPLFRDVSAKTMAKCRRDDTMLMLINGGALIDGLAHLCLEHSIAIFGSSANVSTKGTRYRLEDIEPQIRAIADLEIDYGPVTWNAYRSSSTIIDFRDYSVVRAGIAFDLIEHIAAKHFSIELKVPSPTA